MDKAVMGFMRLGYFRLGVFRDDWETLKQRFETLGSLDVTRRRLQLDSPQDSQTGWWSKSFHDETIEMPIIQKGSSGVALPPGTYVRGDALGLTADVVEEGDEILANNQYYEVKNVRPHYDPGAGFCYRECDLTLLSFKYLTGKTYTAATASDARYRTKVYLQTYLRSAYLPNFIVVYGLPDYPLVRVFKEKGVDLVFAVLDPEPSKALVDSDHYPIGYAEHVPIETFCIDKDNIDGVKVQWQAASELRYVTENYPEGSLRSLDEMRPNRKDLDSTVLYSQRFILTYIRDKT